MKVLLVSHGFPPRANAGTETYTADLGAALAARGHEVVVFAATKDISRPDLTLAERVHRGVRVRELVQNLFHASFRETWDEPRVEAAFARELERFRPDVVHFQHLMYLSAGCVGLARASGAAVLYTLHDYWLTCARFGQRVHADETLCEVVDTARCGTCLAGFKWAQRPLERRMGTALAAVRSLSGVDLAPLARGVADRMQRAGLDDTAFEPAEAPKYALLARERLDGLRERIVPHVQRFLAPSRFLRERLQRELALDPARIAHLPLGVDLARFAPRERVRGERLRVAFLGSLVPRKGPHLLLEAWGALPAELRARGELVVHGPALAGGAYAEKLEVLARESGARLGGPLERDGVADLLARTDLVVVPSTWWENSPLVILEALAMRTPLLVADQGGMAELVEEGRGGFHFALGDARDLAAKLALALRGELGLERLHRPPVELPRFDEHVAGVERHYRDALAEAGRRTPDA